MKRPIQPPPQPLRSSPPVQPRRLPGTRRVTRSGPHVRDAITLARVRNGVVLALLPAVLMGLYNTGYQANRVVSEAGLGMAPGWRGRLLGLLGVRYHPDSILDALCHGVVFYLPFFVVALVVAWFWETLFSILRARPPADGFLVTALLFTLLLPPAAPLWQVAMGITFGVVIASEIFGGAGRNFLHPAAAGIVYLHFAHPGTGEPLWTGLASFSGTRFFGDVHAAGAEVIAQAGTAWWQAFLGLIPGPLGATSCLACILGAGLLLHLRIASWRIMAGALAGLTATLMLFQRFLSGGSPVFQLSLYWHLTLGSFAFVVVFLATDPATSAITDRGRWIHGLLIGCLVVLIRGANPAHPDGAVQALLLGNVLVPLVDSGVIWANVRRRRRIVGA